MRGDYIALAIPGFFLLMGIELAASRLLRRGYYRLADSVADLGCGILQQVTGLFTRGLIAAGYVYLYDHHRLTDVPEASVLAWVGLFFGVDFFYYWFHRASHEVNLLWAAHVVHHQSEEYNLAVALRQGAFQPLFSWIFYLPLALIGFPPPMFGAMVAINTLYQFWIHTRFIPKLGPLEWFLNTPSHHRVHHGRNPEYIDKNHGGTLIVWDRLFGTFAEERAPVVYGVTEPLASFNPLWANFHYFRDLIADGRGAASPWELVKLWLSEPGSRPARRTASGGVPASAVAPPPSRSITLDAPKYDRPVSPRLGAYVLAQLVPIVLGTVYALELRSGAPPGLLPALALAIMVSAASLGALLDGRAWAPSLELARLAVIAVGAALLVYPRGTPAAVGVVVLLVASIAGLRAVGPTAPAPGSAT